MTSHQNASEGFPGLNLKKLKTIAKRWVDDYPLVPIGRITLYGFASPPWMQVGKVREWEKVHGEKKEIVIDLSKDPTKYAVVFEISREKALIESTFEAAMNQIEGADTSQPEISKIQDMITKAYKEFELDTEYYYQTIPDPDRGERFAAFMTADFEDVYIEKPDKGFRNEWIFIPKRPGEALNPAVRVNEAYEVLFKRDDVLNHGIPQAAISLMEKASQEVDILHAAVKKDGYKVEGELRPIRHFRQNALNRFDEIGQDSFDYVKREYLEDPKIYSWRSDQERGDFKGMLCQKIIEDHGLGKFNFQDLYKYYPKK